MDDGGSVILDGGGEFDCGTGSHSITNGTLDNRHQATFTPGAATWTLNGTVTLTGSTDKDFWNLTIAEGAVITVPLGSEVQGTITVDGTISIGGGTFIKSSITTIGASGKITGNGTYQIHFPTAGKGITTFADGGIVDVAKLVIHSPNVAAIMAPGNYQSAVRILNISSTTDYTLTPTAAGVYQFNSFELETTGSNALTLANNTNGPASITINGDLIFDIDSSGNIIVDNSGQATDWTITGDVIDLVTGGGTVIHNKGTGTITAAGGNAQDWNWPTTDTLEDIDVDKTNVADLLTFSGDWTADSFIVTKGTIDYNGRTVETVGDFTMTADSQIHDAADAMNGVAITVGGNLSLSGANGDLLDFQATAGWTLDVTGSAVATYVDVANCNALGGAQIQAADRTSVNSGSNDNWSFVVRPLVGGSLAGMGLVGGGVVA